jgi:deoxyribonuclease V
MLAALDVQYDETARRAASAAVTFDGWEAALPTAEYVAICQNIQPYEPGQFFKRELPCLQAVLEKIREPLAAIVIDGYVNLGDQPGLGWRLWESLDQRVPIIGVAKTKFHSALAMEVLRGESRAPLYVTAVGIASDAAARHIAAMSGDFRIPTLLKRVDQLARAALSNFEVK